MCRLFILNVRSGVAIWTAAKRQFLSLFLGDATFSEINVVSENFKGSSGPTLLELIRILCKCALNVKCIVEALLLR